MHQPWYQRHRLLLSLAVLLIIEWGIWHWLPGPAQLWQSGGESHHPLNATHLKGLQLDLSTQEYVTRNEPGYIQWPGNTTGVLSVSFTITTTDQEINRHWILQYTTQATPWFDDDSIHARSLRPIVQGNSLTWNLPVAAAAFRIVVPPSTRFSIHQHYLTGIHYDAINWHTWRQGLFILFFAINLALFFTWLAPFIKMLRGFLSQPASISLLLLGIQGGVIIWLLPPFLGPDENRHWKEAVRLYRTDGQPGSVLHRLPVILDAESIRWRSELPFQAENFHALPTVHRDREDTKRVSYVKHWGFPIVGLVSLFFPPVNTVSEALVFYYTCRVLTLLLLLTLVAAAWRLNLGSWTLLVFLSFPLVLQQCVIVSTDTVHNLGTFLAVLLFRRHQLVGTRLSWLTLFLVCCLVVISKPPIYLLLLFLPAWFLPWSRFRRPIIWIPALLGLLVLAASSYWYLWRILDGEGHGIGDDARKQLTYVLTGPGVERFFIAGMEYPTRFLSPVFWWEPLGWLDTNINDLHKNLLWISLLVAILFDLPRWIRWFRNPTVTVPVAFYISLVLSLLHLLFVWWSLALVMYLTSDYQSPGITGMQVRYMIPVALLFLTWPGCFMQGQQPVMQGRGWLTFTGVVLLTVAFARTVQLAGDLLLRFW